MGKIAVALILSGFLNSAAGAAECPSVFGIDSHDPMASFRAMGHRQYAPGDSSGAPVLFEHSAKRDLSCDAAADHFLRMTQRFTCSAARNREKSEPLGCMGGDDKSWSVSFERVFVGTPIGDRVIDESYELSVQRRHFEGPPDGEMLLDELTAELGEPVRLLQTGQSIEAFWDCDIGDQPARLFLGVFATELQDGAKGSTQLRLIRRVGAPSATAVEEALCTP